VADLSYHPTFHHDLWVDLQDRVIADGSNGFNVRFEAIERDLQQASTVVGQISVALAEASPANPPVPVQRTLTLTPVLSGFFVNPLGVPRGEVNEFAQGNLGTANLALPDGVRLQNLRVVIDINGGDLGGTQLTVNLLRLPLRLTIPPPGPQTLATVSHSADRSAGEGHVVLDAPVTASLAAVDLGTFRYYLTVSYTGESITGADAAIDSVRIQYST
jgi:hypothetical protein